MGVALNKYVEALAAMLLVAIVTGCSSAPQLVEGGTYVNQPGDPIEITVQGVNVDPAKVHVGGGWTPFEFEVVVANNVDYDVTVTNISVYQSAVSRMVVSDGYSKEVDVTIEPKKEHAFTVSMTAQGADRASGVSSAGNALALRVIVTLSNNDRYSNVFEIPAF